MCNTKTFVKSYTAYPFFLLNFAAAWPNQVSSYTFFTKAIKFSVFPGCLLR